MSFLNNKICLTSQFISLFIYCCFQALFARFMPFFFLCVHQFLVAFWEQGRRRCFYPNMWLNIILGDVFNNMWPISLPNPSGPYIPGENGGWGKRRRVLGLEKRWNKAMPILPPYRVQGESQRRHQVPWVAARTELRKNGSSCGLKSQSPAK